MMNKAYLGLGSNLGKRLDNLKSALSRLASSEAIIIAAISSVYETRPVGGPEQGPYLNACVKVKTTLTPTTLLLALQLVEDELGRVRKERWGPRTIDLDLLIYENIMINSPLLELPHPRLTERDFVLIPLADIAGDLIIPGQTKTVHDLLSTRSPTNDVVLYQRNPWFG